MALARYVLTADVVVTADTLATVVAGEPGTGGAAGYGNASTAPSGTQGKYGIFPSGASGSGSPYSAGLWQKGMVIWADSSAGSTGPQLLYQAIGSANLRAFVDGQDTVGHGAISN